MSALRTVFGGFLPPCPRQIRNIAAIPSQSSSTSAMCHGRTYVLSLFCASILCFAVVRGGNADAGTSNSRSDSTQRREHIALTFFLSHQQTDDWLLGKTFHMDSRCTLQYKSTWTGSKVLMSAEARCYAAATYNTFVPQGVATFRCTDNEISAQVKTVFMQGWILDPYVRASVQTPLTEMFPAFSAPYERSATWWDPIQSDQACGFHCKLRNVSSHSVSMLFGTSLQQVRARTHTKLTDLPATVMMQETYKHTTGIECMLHSDYDIDSTVRISSNWQARGSSAARVMVQSSIDNEIRIKFWRYFGLSLCTNLRYDNSLSKRVTYKHIAQLGIVLDR